MRSWFCLFRDVDVDGSGAIAFDELRAMVRGELRVRESALSEARLKAVWVALDADGSGLISVGEFGQFMHLGAHVHAEQRAHRAAARLRVKADALAAARTKNEAQLDAMRSVRDEFARAKRERAKAINDEGAARSERAHAENAARAERKRASALEQEKLFRAGVEARIGAAAAARDGHAQGEEAARRSLEKERARRASLEEQVKACRDAAREQRAEARAPPRLSRSIAWESTVLSSPLGASSIFQASGP